MGNKWQTMKLGDVIKLEYGKPLSDFKRKPDGAYPVYGANGEKNRTDEYYYDKPSIIVGRKGSAGEINLTEGKFWPLDVTYFATFDHSKHNLTFIYYLLNNLNLPKLAKGVKPGINRNEVYSIDVQIPQFLQQQRIVSILDKAFAAIAKAKENAEKNLKNARELFESYLHGIFSNPNDEWEERTLGDKDLLEIIDGDRGKNYPNKNDFFEEGACLFMNTKNVRPDGFNFETTMFINEEKDRALGNGKLRRNDVVMTTRGTIGNLGIYTDDIDYDSVRINSGMLIFRPNRNKINPEYFFEILRSSIIKDQIKKRVSGAAQPQLPIKTLVKFTFPIPSELSKQRAIVTKLQFLSMETKKLEAIYQQKIAALEELKKSILQKAFNGELT
jgi:type I restriction enzyme S subunit